MERNEYWEQRILNEFELEDDQEDTPENSRSSIYDMLSKEPYVFKISMMLIAIYIVVLTRFIKLSKSKY